MIKNKNTTMLMAVIFFLCICARATYGANVPLSEHESALWDKTVGIYLSQPLWTERDAYDACHMLMVPMHYVFKNHDQKRMEEFDRHAERFIAAFQQGDNKEVVQGRLNKLQYFYLLSEYIKLSAMNHRDNETVRVLAEIVYSYIEQVWVKERAWQWGIKDGYENMRVRLEWKLSQDKTKPSYLKAFIDEEGFTFAISADLQYYFKGRNDGRAILDEILDFAYTVFSQEGKFDTSGRWLMQPGVWADGFSFQYAGHKQSQPNLNPRKIPTIAEDTSHSTRYPLWICSLRDSASPSRQEVYSRILTGLNKQFFEVAVKKPSFYHQYYRTTNYLDGNNGLYRYNYNRSRGYEPYELSGTISLGWWAFLGSDESKEMYSYMANHELTKDAIKLYVGPNTTRDRNSLVRLPDFYHNGFSELLSCLASKL